MYKKSLEFNGSSDYIVLSSGDLVFDNNNFMICVDFKANDIKDIAKISNLFKRKNKNNRK